MNPDGSALVQHVGCGARNRGGIGNASIANSLTSIEENYTMVELGLGMPVTI